MDENQIIEVKTFDGLFDEQCEALTCNISRREFCVKHDFINASLHWQRSFTDERDGVGERGRSYHLSLEAPARENFNYEWGMGYGGIRYCRRCKLIDCIHNFHPAIEYRIITDEFYFQAMTIATCKICKRRITRGGYSSSKGSEEAYKLIERIALEMGKPVPALNTGYGSNYFIVLPRETARLLKRSKEAAEQYVRGVFAQGECNDPNDR